MKSVLAEQPPDIDSTQVSEQELVALARADPIMARMIVRSPNLLATISTSVLPTFLYLIALNDEKTATLIFSQLDVKNLFPVGQDFKTSKLKKIFRYHKTLEYKLEILFHCSSNHPDACKELIGILLNDNVTDMLKLRAALLSFFVLKYNTSYQLRMKFMSNILVHLNMIARNPAGINKMSLATLMKAMLDIQTVLQRMSPFSRLPAPLLARIRADADEETGKVLDESSPSWLKALLKDEQVWKTLLNYDYPGSDFGGMTYCSFYKARRTLDTLPRPDQTHQEAVNEVIEKLYLLSRTGDSHCSLYYVRFFIENILEDNQMDKEYITESDYCLEILERLIAEDYHAADCCQLREKILYSTLGLHDSNDVTTEEDITTTEPAHSDEPETEHSFSDDEEFRPLIQV